MPRTNPISKQDREIASRIREHRRASKCTQSYLAAQIGIEAAAITRIELGRVPLKYDLARILFSLLEANPKWVATGQGNPKGYIDLPHSTDLKINGNETFSSVFFRELWPMFEGDKPETESEEAFRYTRGKIKAGQIEMWFELVPDGYTRELNKGLETFWKEFYSKLPPEDAKNKFRRALRRGSFVAKLKQRIARWNEIAENIVLTDSATYEKLSPDVKPQLPNLRDRLNQATKESGKMSALADYLKVPLASVSRWLSGKREPGGEITLKLLHWVEQQERQK